MMDSHAQVMEFNLANLLMDLIVTIISKAVCLTHIVLLPIISLAFKIMDNFVIMFMILDIVILIKY